MAPGFAFGFGFGAQGGKSTTQGVAGPTAPVLVLLSVTAGAVALAIDVDNTVAAGDTVTLQGQVTGGDWSSLLVNTAHVITSGEDTANEIDLTPAGFANGTYDFRAKVNHVTDSAWSNTISATVTAATPAGRLMWGTDQQLWSTDHLVWS